MPLNCIITRGAGRRVQSVLAPDGKRSRLFDKIASIPTMENRERALSFFKKVYSDKFRRIFGDFTKSRGVPRAIESLNERVRTNFSRDYGSNLRYRFVGDVALANARARISNDIYEKMERNRVIAENLMDNGTEPKLIFMMTGWVFDKGKWKYELPDNFKFRESFLDRADKIASSLRNTTRKGGARIPFSRVVENNSYLEMITSEYPDIANMDIVLYNAVEPSAGGFSRDEGCIYLNMRYLAGQNREELTSTFLHEVQHFIQKKEGFPRGGNYELARMSKQYRERRAELRKEMDDIQAQLDEMAKKDDLFREAKEEMDEIKKVFVSKDQRFTDTYLKTVARYKKVEEKLKEGEKRFNDLVANNGLVSELTAVSMENDRLRDEMAKLWDKLHNPRTRKYRVTTEEEKRAYEKVENKFLNAHYDFLSRNPEAQKLEDSKLEKEEELKELPRRTYLRIAGEVESNNTSERHKLGVQGTMVPWEATSDVPFFQRIFVEDYFQSSYSQNIIDLYTQGAVESETFVPSIGEIISETNVAASEIAERMNINVRVVTKEMIEDSVTDEAIKGDMLNSSGWYDVDSDTIYVVADNNTGAADVQMTVLHEAIVHKGLRNLLGDNFSSVMDAVFESMSESDRANYTSLYGSPEIAAEEYIASLFENGTDPSLIQRIIAAIRSALRSMGVNIQMNDSDIFYMLRRSEANLSRMDERIEGERGNTNTLPAGETYETGEPRLFFMDSEGRLFDNYGDALAGETKTIQAGFITTKLSSEYGAAATDINGEMRLNDREAFIPLAKLSASTDPFHRQGAINYLIKKGYLNGEKAYDKDNRTYRLTGAGRVEENRLRNSALAYYQLGNMLGFRNVTMDERGYIRIRNIRPGMVSMRDRGGRESEVSRSEMRTRLLEGRFNELNRKYDNFDMMVVSIINEMESESARPDAPSRPLTIEEENLKRRIISTLRSLGIRVMGMSDYLEKYEAKHGAEPSVRALADLANGVIAVAEGANIEDVVEEVAHFMVEAYQDQAAIEEAMEGIEETAEWSEFSSQYYKIYGELYSGEELDNAVRREILGKILKNRILSRDVNSNSTGFFARVAALARAIMDWIKANFTTQRATLDSIVSDMEKAFASSDNSQFNSSLLRMSTYTLYSAGQRSEVDVIKSNIERLRQAQTRLRRLGSMRAESVDAVLTQLKPIEDELLKVENKIDDASNLASLSAFINVAEAQANYLEQMLENINNPSENGQLQMEPSDRVNIESISNDIIPMLQDIRIWLKRGANGKLNSKQISAFTQRINNVTAQLGDLVADARVVESAHKEQFLRRMMDKFGVTNEEDRKRIEAQYKATQKDINIFSRWFGTLEFCGNIINRMLGRLIADGNKAAMDTYQRVVNPLTALFRKGGWNVSNIDRIIKKIDGRSSNFLWSRLNMAQFDFDFKRNQMFILRDILKDRIPYFNTLTDAEIDRTIKRGAKFTFEIEKNGKKVQVNFRPSQDKIIDEFMTVDESLKFRERQGQWIAENTEQRMSDKFYERINKVYSDLEKAGKPVSEATKVYLRNMRIEISRIKEPFRSPDGFRWWDYINSPAHGDVQRILKLQREAASKYFYPGDGSRMDKSGEALRLANDLANIAEYNKTNNPFSENRANDEFYRQIRSLSDRARRGEISYRDVFRFVMETGRLQFSDRFWSNVSLATDENGLSAEESRINRIVNLMKKAGAFDNAERVRGQYERIKEKREIIREVLKFSRDVNNPSNTDLSLLNSSDMSTIKEASKEIEDCYKRIKNAIKDSNVKEAENEFQENADREYAFNNAFLDAYNDYASNDLSSKKHRFAMEHMTDAKRKYMSMFVDKMEKKSNMNFTPMEADFLSKELGVSRSLSSGEFRAGVMDQIKNYSEGEIDALLDKYAARLVLPYFRRTEPTGYTAFLESVDRGEVDIERFVRDVQSGREVEYSGFDVRNLSYSANMDFSDMESVNEDDYNPNYNVNHGYGRYMPRVDKYEDKEYMQHFGIKFDENGNEIATRDTETHRFIQALADTMEGNLRRYGVHKRKSKYMLPQISKTRMERFAGLATTPVRTIQNTVKDAILDRYDDSLYGITEDNESTNLGDRPKIIPRYFITELEDSDDLSHDLAYTYAIMTMQSSLYEQRKNSMSDALGLQNLLLDMQFNNGKSASDTNSKAMFDEWMNANFFGIHSNTGRMTWNFLGYNIDMARILMGFERFMSTMNLALSPFVAATGAVTGQINYLIEGAIGQYISRSSINYGYRKMTEEMPAYASEIGNYDRKSPMYVLGEFMGIYNVRDRMYAAGFNRLLRVGTRDLLYKPMEILNSPLGPQVMYAVMDSIRKYKGEYYNYRQFELMMRREGISDVKGEWDKIKNQSLDKLTTTEGGRVHSRETLSEEEEAKYQAALTAARNQIKSLSQIVNGTLNEDNRNSATRNAIFRFTMAHRGWMVIAAQRLHSRANYNFQTGQYEEGLVSSLGEMFKSFREQFSEEGVNSFLDAYNRMKDKMTDYQRMNMRRMAVYLAAFAIMNVISALLFGWRDDDEDDEDWAVQFGTYVGMRTINEIFSQMPIGFASNMADVITDPFVVARKLSDLSDWKNWTGDIVSSGTYEGMSNRWRLFSKMTFLKQWYNASTPEAVARSSDWWQQTNRRSLMFFLGADRGRRDETSSELFDE